MTEYPKTKEELAREKGLCTFDCALPQDWLDSTARRATDCVLKNTQGMEYPSPGVVFDRIYQCILSGTVWCYDGPYSLFGGPVFLTEPAERFYGMAQGIHQRV